MAVGNNFTILATVEADTSKIQQQLNSTKVSFGVEAHGARSVDDLALSVNAANQVFRVAIDLTGKLVEQVFELDHAVTEFKKVTTLQGRALDEYVNKLGDAGKIVARTKAEMVEAAMQFKKSSYSDTESKDLALVASLYQNVADQKVSSGEASDFIVSQLKAFHLEAEDAIHVVDALNEVSNNFAVSSADLSNNLGKASAALASGNTTYEETLGLNKNTNRPSKIGLIVGETYKLYTLSYYSNIMVA